MTNSAIVVLLCALAAPLASGCERKIDPKLQSGADEIEKSISLPNGSSPLNKYARYYTKETRDGRLVIHGQFVAGMERPGRYFQTERRFVSDGGCSVIGVYLDVLTRRLSEPQCNGEA